jgi:hypothetical protein
MSIFQNLEEDSRKEVACGQKKRYNKLNISKLIKWYNNTSVMGYKVIQSILTKFFP